MFTVVIDLLLVQSFLLAPLPLQARVQNEDKEQKFDQIIDRFIEYDTGKLSGPQGKQALVEFNNLGTEGMPALIRGLNRAAKIEHSCPAVTIGKKLNRMIRAAQSREVLEFARENIGAGVTQSRHMGVINDLRLLCTLRKRSLAGREAATSDDSPEERPTSGLEAQPRKRVSQMSVRELAEAVGTAKGIRLRMVLTELGKHKTDEAIDALGTAASVHEGDYRKLAREYLDKLMADLDDASLLQKLKDDRT
jgi:hypothetical protein